MNDFARMRRLRDKRAEQAWVDELLAVVKRLRTLTDAISSLRHQPIQRARTAALAGQLAEVERMLLEVADAEYRAPQSDTCLALLAILHSFALDPTLSDAQARQASVRAFERVASLLSHRERAALAKSNRMVAEIKRDLAAAVRTQVKG